MLVCPRPKRKKCRLFQWKNPPNQRDEVPPSETATGRSRSPESINSTPSKFTPPTTPEKPHRARGTYTCNCKKPAREFFCRKGNPNNGKYFYRCPDKKCRYFKWHESQQDARRRIDERKRKREQENAGKPKKKFKCDCGRPAKRGWSEHGMEHNNEKAYYYCATRTCGFWVWADGSLPFSDESQARFNDYMDALNGYEEDMW